ncbi:MAG: hypothetical protein Q8N69_02110 [bacterium]|nr:hypothetical protein [bacterium]
MADPKVVNFIKGMLKNGISLNSIKSQLKEKGWPEKEINDAIDLAIPSDTENETTSQENAPLLRGINPKNAWKKIKTLIKKKCPYCSYTISDKDMFCPDCGRKLKEEEKEQKQEQKITVIINKEGEKIEVKRTEEERPFGERIKTTGRVLLTICAILFVIVSLIKSFNNPLTPFRLLLFIITVIPVLIYIFYEIRRGVKEPGIRKSWKSVFGVVDSFATGVFIFLAFVLLIFLLIKYFDIRPEVKGCIYWPGVEANEETVPIFPIIFGEDYQISKCKLINSKAVLFIIGIICSSIVIAYSIILEAYKGLKKA